MFQGVPAFFSPDKLDTLYRVLQMQSSQPVIGKLHSLVAKINSKRREVDSQSHADIAHTYTSRKLNVMDLDSDFTCSTDLHANVD